MLYYSILKACTRIFDNLRISDEIMIWMNSINFNKYWNLFIAEDRILPRRVHYTKMAAICINAESVTAHLLLHCKERLPEYSPVRCLLIFSFFVVLAFVAASLWGENNIKRNPNSANIGAPLQGWFERVVDWLLRGQTAYYFQKKR